MSPTLACLATPLSELDSQCSGKVAQACCNSNYKVRALVYLSVSPWTVEILCLIAVANVLSLPVTPGSFLSTVLLPADKQSAVDLTFEVVAPLSQYHDLSHELLLEGAASLFVLLLLLLPSHEFELLTGAGGL